jgi:hypothetical protein
MSKYTNEELRVKAQCVMRWLQEGDMQAQMFIMTMAQVTGMDPNWVYQNIIALSQLQD